MKRPRQPPLEFLRPSLLVVPSEAEGSNWVTRSIVTAHRAHNQPRAHHKPSLLEEAYTDVAISIRRNPGVLSNGF